MRADSSRKDDENSRMDYTDDITEIVESSSLLDSIEESLRKYPNPTEKQP